MLLLDGTRGLEAQDLKIADSALQEGRALIVAINKWDVAEEGSSLFNGIKAALEEGPRDSRPILQVHEEVLLDVPPAEHDAAAKLVVEAMAGAVDLSVPLEVNLAFGDTWADAKG